MSIAHILSNPIIGGVEALVVELAREQTASGYVCVIINFWHGSDVERLSANASVPLEG